MYMIIPPPIVLSSVPRKMVILCYLEPWILPPEFCTNRLMDPSPKPQNRWKHLSPPRSLKRNRNAGRRHKFLCIVSRRKISFFRTKMRGVCSTVISYIANENLFSRVQGKGSERKTRKNQCLCFITQRTRCSILH